jgi:ATP-dependent DNA helicase RecQ
VEARAALKHHFGYDEFRPGQERVIFGVLAGRDGLAVMPTGAGKSICYQVPAAMLPGVAIVVSPLISLMEDQVASLDAVGISAACLTSHKLPFERREAMNAALNGYIKVLYVAPERLTDPAFANFLATVQLSLIAVDEAHCVSQWGQDFRQSYLQIGPLLESLSRRPPVLALTATATPRVREDIITLLGLKDPTFTITTFDRPNLNLGVEKLTKARKTARIAAHVLAHKDESGIVYCATRKEVERVTDELREAGVSAAAYHAGLDPGARARAQRAFIVDDVRVMVATSAFGMGIDKPDCMLFWNDGDFATLRFFIDRDVEEDAYTPEQREAVRATQTRMLSVMANYCLTGECLHDFILRYFGETPPKRDDKEASTKESASGEGPARGNVVAEVAGCGMCSNCTGAVRSVDVTEDARAVLRCVHALRGRFGKNVIADLCTGANNARTRELRGLCEKSFDSLKCTKDEALDLIEMLVARQLLSVAPGEYPTIGLGPFWREAGDSDFKVSIKGRTAKVTNAASGAVVGRSVREDDAVLFEALRDLRKKMADDEGKPPYVVCSDATLRDMCARKPKDEIALLEVHGIGPHKAAKYGEQFLQVIERYR